MAYKKYIFSIIICLILVLITAFVITFLHSYSVEEFNFDSIRKNEKIKWNGPKEGEKINLSNFKNEKGESFPNLTNNNLVLISFVNPRCKMCEDSKDLIKQVQLRSTSKNVQFGIVSLFPPSKKKFFDYAKKLFGENRIYIWEGEQIPRSLREMVIPSHLLLDGDGIVLRRFPGSSLKTEIREQMANQIIEEMNLEIDKNIVRE